MDENKTEMKAGHVVRLKSGGPDMIIESIFTVSAGLTANCVWFTSDGVCQRSEFLCCMLMVEPFPVDRL